MGFLLQGQEGKERIIASTFQLLSLEAVDHLERYLPKYLIKQRFSKDQSFRCPLQADCARRSHNQIPSPAATATFAGRVQGVVVHTSSEVSGSSTSGIRTNTEGSSAILVTLSHLMV